jgi:hypothetical protein
MTDLETRVREGLDGAPAWRSPDALLDDVRRGARRRRARRTTGLVAATVVALVVAGGGVAWHRQRVSAAERPQDALRKGSLTVSVDASGAAYQVVANEGCAAPCSTILRSDGTGGWTRLGTILDDSPQARPYGPVTTLEMAPTGRDGWAWGSHVWSTHDGGRTWSRVTTGPGSGRPWDTNLDLSPGPTLTWALMARGHDLQLWRTATGSDAWTRVPLPPGAGRMGIAAVLPDSRIALPVVKGVDEFKRVRRPGKRIELIGRYDVGDGDGHWQRVMVPCIWRRLPIKEEPRQELCAPAGHRGQGGGELLGPKTPPGVQRFKDVTIDAGAAGPSTLGVENELHLTPWQAVLSTPTGTVPVDLHLDGYSGNTQEALWGSHVVILNDDRQIFASNDGGRHWTQLK